MAKLILLLMSLVLVVLLAVAGYVYIVPATKGAGTKSDATALMAQYSQIRGAAVLYYNNTGMPPSSTSTLGAAGYLASVPPGWTLVPDASGVELEATIGVGDAKTCETVNASNGFTGPVPACSSNTAGAVCCSN